MTIQRADSKILILYNCLRPAPYGRDPIMAKPCYSLK